MIFNNILEAMGNTPMIQGSVTAVAKRIEACIK